MSAPPATSETPALNFKKETVSPKSNASDKTNDSVADVYKSLFGDSFPASDSVENQSFLAVTVKNA